MSEKRSAEERSIFNEKTEKIEKYEEKNIIGEKSAAEEKNADGKDATDENASLHLQEKRFQKNDAGFQCTNCGFQVLPLGTSSRNHCPKCLCSLHVDINPGDRANPCKGLLRPVSAIPDAKKGYIILQKCDKCGEICRNRAAHDAKIQPDDLRLLIALTTVAPPDEPKRILPKERNGRKSRYPRTK